MKISSLSLTTIAVAMFLSGCATVPNSGNADSKATSAGAGAVLGCLGGVLLAKLTGGDAATGCAAGAVLGGVVGFEKARREEVAAAEQAQRDAVAALQTLPPSMARDVKAGDVKTVEVVVTDKNTQEKKKYTAFSSVSVDIPLSAKGTPEFDAAMGKLKTLAIRVADERGASNIDVAMTPQDAKAQKMSMESGTVKTPAGNVVTVSKSTDLTVATGLQRVTVTAGKLRTEV